MGSSWTAEQIIALAPDPASAKAGRDLAGPRKWVTLGATEAALWGECQGSGANPYQTRIDLSEPAFKCSCPSRKFPCKHGLGLFLLYVQNAALFKANQPPVWLTEWLTSRAAKTEQKAKRKEEAAAAPVDPAAQAKRIADREKKVTAGLAEIELWLGDIIRQGVAAAQSKPATFWESAAARMVDAQAAGVARLIRDAADACTGHQWQDRLLDRLSKIHLLIEAYRRLDALSTPLAADVRTLVGWNEKQEDVLSRGEGVNDTWAVVAQQNDTEDRLRVQRNWLWGRKTRRAALVLQFAHGTLPFEHALAPATQFDGEVVYFPSATPSRALIKSRANTTSIDGELTGFPSLDDAAAAYAAALASNPWLDAYPVLLNRVVPAASDQQDAWLLRDAAGHAWPLPPASPWGWHLLATSGGHGVHVFGEYDGHALSPLGVHGAEGYVAFKANGGSSG